MGSYIPFTDEQREQARRTDLVAFLRQCGEEVKKSGSENMWLDHGQKVTIRGNLWFHQYEQVGGDAIDFACRFYGMDYPEAVQLMLSMGVALVHGNVEPFSRQLLEPPLKHENMRRVYGYLIRRRGIDKDVLDAFAYRELVYESSDYHNAVFVGVDKTGKPRHIHKHSTAAQGGFKGNAPGSEPEYSFHWIGGGDTLFLFEAPIDMLSFITLHKQSWKSYSFAAACGVSDRVLWQTLKDRPYIRKVIICLDNDETGQKAAQRISKALGDKNICNKILVPTRKDWNEDLLFLRKEGAE
ncbi:MAG: DUF3991 and toprim domain-containing protein [Candidatus Limivicinus sp.]